MGMKPKNAETICANCGIKFKLRKDLLERGQKYCSRSCAFVRQRKKIEISCDYCGALFETIPCDLNNGRRFCSNSCSNTQRNKANSVSSEELFFKNISNESHPNDCWIYKHTNQEGYGKITINQKTVLAHRYSYQINIDIISDGLCVCHKCDNPPCVNPDHLFLGTNGDNMQDKQIKGRARCGIGSKQGHAKLNEQQVLEIKQKLKNGEKVKKLYEDYNVSQPAISNIKNGRNWKHVIL